MQHRNHWVTAVLKFILLATLVAALAVIGYVRLVPHDTARWHLDPRRVTRPATPNFHLLRMGDGDAPAALFDMSPSELAERLHAVALADGATLLAGSVAEGHMTFLSRSRLMGYPDYTTVLIEPAGNGAMLTAIARARFGYSDMGVNRARLDGWIAELSG